MRVIIMGRSRSGTTILRNILSVLPQIYITNEMRIYNMLAETTTAGEYFQLLSGKIKPYHKLPRSITVPDFQKQCGVYLNDDSVCARLAAVEKTLFRNSYTIYGDKTIIDKSMVEFLLEHDIDFKIIHIYRDGRDCVSSGMKFEKQRPSKRAWSLSDPREGSIQWATRLNEVFEIKDLLDEDVFAEVRFEDLAFNLDIFVSTLVDFLNLGDKSLLVKSCKRFFNKDRSNIGYYKEWVPNWKDVFCDEAIDLLKKLEYIK